MAAPRTPRKPTFFWQGVLILLPVALMAGFGLWAILRERRAVEQAARQKAQETLQALPQDFGRSVGTEINCFALFSSSWLADQRAGAAAWQESKERPLNEAGGAGFHASVMESWENRFPGLQPENMVIGEFVIKPDGGFSYDDPPKPAAWVAALTSRQWQSWTMLSQAEYASMPASNLVGLVDEFLNTQPSSPARACAEFCRLRAELDGKQTSGVISALLEFARRNEGVLSESGVPLSNLVLAEALRCAQKTGATEPLWQRLTGEVERSPSVLTPSLLDQADLLVEKDARLRKPVGALRQLWAAHQRQRALAEVVRASAGPHGLSPTSQWVDFLGGRWFCVVAPSLEKGLFSDTNSAQMPATNKTALTVRAFPKVAVEHSFDVMLHMMLFRSKHIPPGWCRLSVELESEPISLFGRPSGDREQHPPSDVLAEQQGYLTAPASTGQFDPQTRRPLIDPQTGRPVRIEFDYMPSHPRFTLRVHLADRAALYAEFCQRQFIFGSLIALSALAAFVGFVTARRAFFKQQQLNEMKSNFVSSVSHELRAPIASVRLLAENLEGAKVPEPQKQKEYFGFIVQECRRLSALIENVLDFSRIEQGRKQYEFEPTDLVALVQTTVKLMEPNAAEKGVSLKEETSLAAPERGEGGNIEMEIDGRAIQQALVNLIDNAIKHSPKGETVTVEIKSSAGVSPAIENKTTAGTAVLLSVSDHGPGIPPEEHEKIFERFYRRGSELRRETQGVGIGLSIVKHIVEAHGGRVLVESAIGQGSRFVIKLPIQP